MEKLIKMANMYVATLRALYLKHQQCHWVSKGETFYGDHLLFERLYKKAAEDSDAAAEKFIGLLGEEAVDYTEQNTCLSKLLTKYGEYNGERLAMLALKLEKDFLGFSKQIYLEFEKADQMTQGLDDLILSIASSHEEACYLLQQKLKD